MTHPMFDLSGKVAVVSGAAQGMGQATAIATAEAGADVVVVDRNLDGAETTAATCREVGAKTLVAGTDVSSPEAIAELFSLVDSEFGRVDFLGNIAGDGHLCKPENLVIEDLLRVLQNLVGTAASGSGFDVPLALPFAPAGQQISPGDVWHFQGWFRDGASANFTDVVTVTFP